MFVSANNKGAIAKICALLILSKEIKHTVYFDGQCREWLQFLARIFATIRCNTVLAAFVL
jgi:hypothetical protein